jgi:histidine phosphotransferase ChpT
MADDMPDLAPLLASRICHDLASPLGALMAGLDLMEMAGPPTPELALMRESVDSARATLDLMRLAFGQASTGASVDSEVLRRLLAAPLAARPRLSLTWAVDGSLTRSEAQQLTLALMCALHALPRGGTLRVAREGAALALTASGQIAADPALWDGLSGHAALPDPDPRRIEFGFLGRLLAENDAALLISHDSETLRLILSQAKAD